MVFAWLVACSDPVAERGAPLVETTTPPTDTGGSTVPPAVGSTATFLYTVSGVTQCEQVVDLELTPDLPLVKVREEQTLTLVLPPT